MAVKRTASAHYVILFQQLFRKEKEKAIQPDQEDTKMLQHRRYFIFSSKEDTMMMNLRLDPQILNKVPKHNILKDNKKQSDSKNSSIALGQRKR
jgi:hypothetical protein